MRRPAHRGPGGDAAGRPRRRAPARARSSRRPCIGINVVVYLISIAQGAGGLQPAQEFINRWALNGFAVSEGEWYRLLTGAFLHASLIHLAFNMLMLWWFGQALEAAARPRALPGRLLRLARSQARRERCS